LGKENYIDECTRKERTGILWPKAGIWKLRGIRRGSDRGRCPLYLGEVDAKHILIKCPEAMCNKWLIINEDIACRKIISCKNVTGIKTIGKFLFKTKCKWETKVKNGYKPP
jgi:hypothetical protein